MQYKRAFDICFSLIGFILLSPLFLAIAILLKVKSKGSVFFTQQRVGQHGRLFTMIKFSTMTDNHGGSTITIKGESRITPLGAKLRKHKLDELPELWNVLKGEMSFVGPRPDVPGYADKLEGEDRKILDVKPGLTGPATLKYIYEEDLLAEQEDPIRYNDEIIYPDKVRINLNYVKNWSFGLDLKIIFLTILGKKL